MEASGSERKRLDRLAISFLVVGGIVIASALVALLAGVYNWYLGVLTGLSLTSAGLGRASATPKLI
jgi:hypothetical protein